MHLITFFCNFFVCVRGKADNYNEDQEEFEELEQLRGQNRPVPLGQSNGARLKADDIRGIRQICGRAGERPAGNSAKLRQGFLKGRG